MTRVLVTGATGFVGRHLCDALLAAGHAVRALVRRPDAGLPPAVECAPAADLHDGAAVAAALARVDAVVHLAARVHVMREAAADPRAAFRHTNVDGTRLLAEQAADAGARSFVFVSSVKAVGEATAAPWTERTPPAPLDPYGVSKLEAEAAARDVADRRGLHAPILRFPLVYGPGMKANMLRLFALVDRGVPLPLGSVHNARSLLYVGNAAAAIVAVLRAPAAARETYFVSDGRDLSSPELVRAIAAALGRPARLVPVPPALFRTAGRAGDLLARAFPFPLTTAAVDRLLGSLSVDSSKLRNTLPFSPPFTVEEGLRHTAEWFRRQRATA